MHVCFDDAGQRVILLQHVSISLHFTLTTSKTLQNKLTYQVDRTGSAIRATDGPTDDPFFAAKTPQKR